jgi:hypothetical protein
MTMPSIPTTDYRSIRRHRQQEQEKKRTSNPPVTFGCVRYCQIGGSASAAAMAASNEAMWGSTTSSGGAAAAGPCAFPTVPRLLRSHVCDWIALLLLVAVDAGLNLVEPFHRFVGAGMMADLRYPMKANTVPVWAVPVRAATNHLSPRSLSSQFLVKICLASPVN